MHRLGVFLVLIGGDRLASINIFLHEQRTAVTLSTGFRDVIVVDHTPRVGGRQNPMNPMAIGADRHIGILPAGKLLAVYRSFVELQLISW